MGGEPVGHRLDRAGLAALAHLLGYPRGALEDRLEVHAVDLLAFDAVGIELRRQVGHRR